MNAAVNLPDDVDALKAIILAQSEQNARLEALIAALRQAMFGRKSEKIDPDQFELALEDIEAGIARVEAEGEANELVTTTATTKPRRTNRGSLPKHLPRIEDIIDPEETACACGTERHVIGEDVSERLDVIPAQFRVPVPGASSGCQFRVIVTRRPKYACRSCTNGVVQAPAPARLIPGGMPTEATVAHVLPLNDAKHRLPGNGSANTRTICLCIGRRRFTAAKASILIAPRWRPGSARPPLSCGPCSTP